ncbi:MAG: 4-hydroxy-tetrahydrodipicolinate reductase [Bacillota bacterium]|nr:4-hydroxy-tetrahydrodipicolinate reductase [Bacillota bacterium]
MTKILLCGYNGKMGKVIIEAVNERNNCEIFCGVDLYGNGDMDFFEFKTFSEVDKKPDVIIDFSNPALIDDILDFAVKNNVPAVICTTGFSAEQVKKIKDAAKDVAIFYSGNMSLGINLIIELSKKAAAVFGNAFDIEIIEKHHNQKIDAPSGTALMIADGISSVLEAEPQYVYDRHAYRKKRSKNEIGIHAVRGGTIVGEHEVIFAGHDEVLSIKHQATSKEVFATGAVNAAVFMANQKAGLYDMSDLLQNV